MRLSGHSRLPFLCRTCRIRDSSLIAPQTGNTPESYANIPVFCGANPEAKEKLETGFVNFLCQSRQPSQWATNEGNRDKLWATLSGMLQ